MLIAVVKMYVVLFLRMYMQLKGFYLSHEARTRVYYLPHMSEGMESILRNM